MAEFLIFQIAVTLFAIFAISRVILRAHNRDISLRAFALWTILWLGLIIVVYLPVVLTDIAAATGIGRGVDFLLYISVGLLFYLAFKQYVKVQQLEHEISSLTTHVAVSQVKDGRKR